MSNSDEQTASSKPEQDRDTSAIGDNHREQDSRLQVGVFIAAAFCLVIVTMFMLGAFSESAVERHIRENPESFNRVTEELWGKPDENITTLPKLD